MSSEALRQQEFMAALSAHGRNAAMPRGVRSWPGRGAQVTDGLQAYQRNAHSVAVRALAAAYPVLSELLGEEALAALAHEAWQVSPPVRGDLAQFGDRLPELAAAVPAWSDMPWLADVARLEWAVHRAQSAGGASVPDLRALEGADVDALVVEWAPGCALVPSPWPVVAIWQAHQAGADRAHGLALARAAVVAQQPECAWVSRAGLQVTVEALCAPWQALHSDLLGGQTLGVALTRVSHAHPDFDFTGWLTQALQAQWLSAVRLVHSPSPGASHDPMA